MKQFRAYLKRISQIEENPFWATHASRSRRTPPLRKLWRHFAGFSLLLMLPLCWGFNFVSALDGPVDLSLLRALVCGAGVLQLLYVGLKATLSTSPSVVQARQQGTLLGLALTRINSADFADGVALSEAWGVTREVLIWTPVLACMTCSAGLSLYSLLMLMVISGLLALYSAYRGVLVSATSKDVHSAGRAATVGTFTTLILSPALFFCGGFVLGPLWLLHPLFGYLCSALGYGSPASGDFSESIRLLFWAGWPLFVLPGYAWLILNIRQSAIRALERVRII